MTNNVEADVLLLEKLLHEPVVDFRDAVKNQLSAIRKMEFDPITAYFLSGDLTEFLKPVAEDPKLRALYTEAGILSQEFLEEIAKM
ncbi:MAG TPA: hypothetical protein QGH03_00195 [Candidatus Paceibacterota bacterium]|nr:hypothetical protein [Parcubacteria group bacterium]MDP6119482.1 hypothetical protein [Candidatus Paceibacterota bacterium]HJN62646.1 hypothetical protein [Candidatus Paceibacterota bacterium]